MNTSIEQFRSNIGRIRQNLALYPLLKATASDASDMTDYLRGEIAACISCFDYYIHDLVRIGSIEAFKGERPRTKHFNAFQVALGGTISVLQGQDPVVWFDSELRIKTKWKAYQREDKVSEAIRMIYEGNLWNELAIKMNRKPADIRVRLNAISDRRNKIVHEYDLDPSNIGARWAIDLLDVTEAVDYISTLGEHIFQIIRNE